MSNTVTVTAPVEYFAWPTPTSVHIAYPSDLPIQDSPAMELGDVPIEVIDALAAKWLDHLYANLGKASPFARAAITKATEIERG